MATAELTVTPRGLARPLSLAYTTGWTILLAGAGICAAIPAASALAHHELALRLHVHIQPAPPPSPSGAVALLVNNLRATGWPLLAAALHAERSTGVRRLCHLAVVVSLSANLLPVAAAVGLYRSALLPYLPHLPLELYAITTGPAGWLLATRRRISERQLAVLAGTLAIALVGAAVLETWDVPHR